MASWSSTDCPQVAPVGIFDTFNVDRDAILGRQLHELENGQGDEPDLRHLLEAAIHRNQTCLGKATVKRNTRPEPGAIMRISFSCSSRLFSRFSRESWLGKFGQVDRWSFCLTAA